jgi:DNA-binding transcriptional MerR regulator
VIDLWPRHGRGRPALDAGAADVVDDDRPAHARRAVDVARSLVAHRRRRDGGASDAGTTSVRASGLLTEEEIAAIETTYPTGITAVQIVEVFTSRGVKFSEASFRKYVQQGLLPRSRRVGRKGKHRGSLGVYPAKTIRRINYVKQLMNTGLTIEEIQAEHLLYADLLENVIEAIGDVFDRMEADANAPEHDAATRKTLGRELESAHRAADELRRQLLELHRRLAAPNANRIRRTGGGGGGGGGGGRWVGGGPYFWVSF